jgi:hypothetical protein
MLFSGPEFIYVFLPVVFLGFVLCDQLKSRAAVLFWLIACSLFFYGCWSPKYLILIVVLIVANFALSRLILVRAEYEDPLDKEVSIDPRAFEDLKAVIDEAHKLGVRVLAYYFPNSLWRSESAVRDGNWFRYEAQVRTHLNAPLDVVWDMMTPDYDSLRDDAACYTDGHLSAASARVALADNHELAVKVRGVNAPVVFPHRERFACLGRPATFAAP